MMKDRIYSAILILGVLLCAFLLRYFESIFFDAFWLGVTLVAVYEMIRISKRRGNTAFEWINYAYPIAFLALVLVARFSDMQFYELVIVEMSLLIAVSLILLIIPFCFKQKIVYDEEKFDSPRDYLMNKSLTTLNIIIYPTILLSLMFTLNHIVDLGIVGTGQSNVVIGMFAILLTFAISMATDTFAMLGGMLFKGRKLCPLISPNKTVSGFITGVIFGVLASMLMYGIFTAVDATNALFTTAKVGLWQFALVGFFGALATSAGDLFASYLKRRAFVKDFGRAFPGHGGFMDRLNGVCFCLVFVLLFFIIFF